MAGIVEGNHWESKGGTKCRIKEETATIHKNGCWKASQREFRQEGSVVKVGIKGG